MTAASTRASSRRAALPGPFRRLWRQPLRVGAIALLGATALAASGIQSAAALALRTSLDENWRGAYDILVAPPDAVQPLDGLLPTNSLGSTETGMTFADLAAVRAVAGVEVAAPIGEILAPGLRPGSAEVAIPRGFVAGADREPQAFRLTTTYATDDGLGERIIEQRRYALVVDEASKRGALEDCAPSATIFTGRHGEYTADPQTYPLLASTVCYLFGMGPGISLSVDDNWWTTGTDAEDDGDLVFSLPTGPNTVTRITLIDPEAERALLGEAGDFLDPLIAAHPSGDTSTRDLQEWARVQGGEYAERLASQLAASSGYGDGWSPEALDQVRQLFRDNGDDFDAMVSEGFSATRYLPLLVSEDAVAPLSLKLDVEGGFGAATAVDPTQTASGWILPDALTSGAAGTPVGSVVGDVSALLNPFTPETAPLMWPGAQRSHADASAPSLPILQLTAVGRVVGEAYGAAEGRHTIDAAGYAEPVSTLPLPEDLLRLDGLATHVGAEAAYAAPSLLWTTGTDEPPVVAVPLATYAAGGAVKGEDAADYVPLGAYAPVGSTLSGGDDAGATLQPSVFGLGLVSTRTGAIASIDSAALWGDDHPISAIRVRVGGIDGYSAASQRKVIDVANAIADLGFTATIVAGSSPTDAELDVRGYAFGTTDPSQSQEVGDLGTVTQRWSELGAAARVSLSVSTATLAILGIALASGILLLGAVQLAGIPGRRDQAAVMREVGFTRARIARWFAAEEVPGLVVVAAVGAVAWWVSGGTGITAVAGVAAAAAVLVAAIVSVVAGSWVRGARMPRDARSRRLGARSVAAFGARQALVHPLTTAVHIVAIVIVGLSAAGLAAALLAARVASGESSLALLTLGQQLWPQLALGAAGIAGGILLARLTRRLDLARRADQWATLRAAGWTGAQLGAAQRAEGIAVVAPALVVTLALAWTGAWRLDLAPAGVYLAVAVGAGLVTALVAFSTRRKGTA